jgi:hypothetical protein
LFKIATPGVSMYIGIIIQIGSSLLFFFFLPYTPSYGGCNRFKYSIYSFLYRQYTNHIHLLTSLFHLHHLRCDIPLAWSVFYNIACICIGYIFLIWEKTCGYCPSEPGQLHLRWCSPVPFIYLWMTKFHSSLWLNKISCILITHFLNPFSSSGAYGS